MTMQHHEAGAAPVGAENYQGPGILDALVARIFAKAEHGRLRIETPNGRMFMVEGRRPGPQAQLKIHHWRALRRLVGGWDMGAAEAYMAGEWSTQNLVALIGYVVCNAKVSASFAALRPPRLLNRLRHAFNRNTRRGSRRNIVAHYDLGNAFYKTWLDNGMNYSSALFTDNARNLEDAQRVKLDRIVDLLDIQGGEDVLEVGCGWGALAERLAVRGDVAVTGITLSDEQLAYARERLRTHGSGSGCDLRIQDYRDVTGTYDRVVSIEMLEAVGEAYWPLFFAKLNGSLRQKGLAVLQVITIDQDRFAQYRRRPDFIQKYVFPGGMLPTKEIIEREVAKAGLRLVATEYFKESYASTLAEWNRRFQLSWPSIQGGQFDLRFKRMWEYYLAYCQAGFDAGILDVGLYKIAK